jgi:hypothetical protein
MKRIVENVVEKVDYEPGVFTVQSHDWGKCVCGCSEKLVLATVAAHIIDKGLPPRRMASAPVWSRSALGSRLRFLPRPQFEKASKHHGQDSQDRRREGPQEAHWASSRHSRQGDRQTDAKDRAEEASRPRDGQRRSGAVVALLPLKVTSREDACRTRGTRISA